MIFLTGDGNNPGAEAGHTGVHIGEAASASNTPRDGSDGVSSSDQWATRVSHAGALSGSSEGADVAGGDHGSVAGSVKGLAVSVGDGLGVQEHQVGGSTAGVLLRMRKGSREIGGGRY